MMVAVMVCSGAGAKGEAIARKVKLQMVIWRNFNRVSAGAPFRLSLRFSKKRKASAASMSASRPSEFLSVRGRRLEYRRIAGAGPTLVFLH
jgi:hypothetical protein